MHAKLVLTDSGGLQEETTVLGIPCITLRNNTERPVTCEVGTNILVGNDPAAILAAARPILAGRRSAAGCRTVGRTCSGTDRGGTVAAGLKKQSGFLGVLVPWWHKFDEGQPMSLTPERTLATFPLGHLLLAIVAIGVAYATIVPPMVMDWYHDENYSHGFLVPLISGYFLYEKWPELKTAACSRATPGWP